VQELRTDHGFHSIEVEDIVGIAVEDERPDPRVYHVLQVWFARPHPVARLRKMFVDVKVRFLPGNFGSDFRLDTMNVVGKVWRIKIWIC